MTSLGFLIKLEKCVMTKVQTIEFLGWTLNSKEMTIKLPRTKRSILVALLRKWMRFPERTNKDLAALVGSLLFLRLVIPEACLYLFYLEKINLRYKPCEITTTGSGRWES